MALIMKDDNVVDQTKQESAAIFLTADELTWLLRTIKDCSFKGAEVQIVYETTVKLQIMLNQQKQRG